MNRRLFYIVLGAILVSARAGLAADWITHPSHFTHDPQTGQRVSQYTPIGPFYTFARQDFMRSGYRHTRSSLQVGHSMDHMHIVEEWGRPVRPYGEWRFPFRPYSVPYADWGPPFAGLGAPWGGFPWGGMPPQGDGGGNLPNPYSQQQPPPYYDGSYQYYRSRPPLQERPWSDGRRPYPPHGGAPGHGGGPGGPGGGGGHPGGPPPKGGGGSA